MVDWIAIRTEYETSNTSYRKLAIKYDVCFSTLEKRARKEKWNNGKKKACEKIATKVRQKTVNEVVDRNTRHLNIWDSFLDNVEQMIKAGEIESDDLRSLSAVMEKAQNGQRKALGLDDKNKDDEKPIEITIKRKTL